MTRSSARVTVSIAALALGLPACRDAELAPPASRVRSDRGAGIPAGPAAQAQDVRAPGTRQSGTSAPPDPDTRQSGTDSGADAQPVDDSEPALFRQLDETFGRKGEVKDGVYRLVTPRSDLTVTMDGRDVATGAFLESDFRFWRCPCGKLLVNGQFVLADYESNDVVNELQKGHLHVVSIGPLLLHEQPRLLLVRFQGEGDAKGIASTLRSALSYTGEERSKPLRPFDRPPTPRE